MRTISVEEKVVVDATTTITVSTEVMIGDDGEAAAAGLEARAAMNAFVSGYCGPED